MKSNIKYNAIVCCDGKSHEAEFTSKTKAEAYLREYIFTSIPRGARCTWNISTYTTIVEKGIGVGGIRRIYSAKSSRNIYPCI